MDLQTYFNAGSGNPINTLSLKENEGLKICNEKFVHLYEFYLNNKKKSNHALVKDTNAIEELYLLVNEIDVKLDSNVEIVDIQLEDKTLLLKLKLWDSLYSQIEETFNYELDRPEVAIEMKTILEQEKTIIYLLLAVDSYLLRISSKEVEINEQIKIKIVDCINEYLKEYGKYSIEATDNKEDLAIFDKYNWVDAASYLQTNVLRFDYIKPWFEDTWNILMFDGPVTSKNIVESEYCTDYKKADIIVWLLTLYHLFFDYQTLIKAEPIDKNDKSFREKNLIKFLNSICENEWEGLISKYLYKSIMSKLNECLITGYKSKYNFYENGREYFNFYYESEDDYSLPFEVLIEEIRKRRSIIVERIYRHFEYNNKEIVIFLTGYHWREHYTDYYKRIQNAYNEFNRYLNIVKDMPEKLDEFFNSFEELTVEISEEYPVSVDNIADQILGVICGGSYSRYAKLSPVFVWVTIDHMQPLQ